MLELVKRTYIILHFSHRAVFISDSLSKGEAPLAMRKKGRPTKTSSTMGKRKRANGNGKTDTAGARVEGTRVEYTLASLPRDLVKYWRSSS